jgi:CBS domain-containing protein
MNSNWRNHLIDSKSTVKEALIKLDLLAANAIVFVVDGLDVLQGSLTDGDIRRALINDQSLESGVSSIVNSNPKSLVKGAYSLNDVIELREKGFDIVPVVDSERKVINVINLRQLKSYLPLDAVIMAGGRGSRLRPLTDNRSLF